MEEAIASVSNRTYPMTVSNSLIARAAWIDDDARRNGIHLVAGPGAGKSRALGRLLGWFRLSAR